jgi:chromosome segregation ATPase
MSPMSDQPLTLAVLADFHQDIFLPDVQRIVAEAIAGSESRMQANFDAIFHKLHKLETEYQSLKAGLKRVEERLDRMVERFDGVEARLESLERQYQELLAAYHRLEERLSRVEKQLDAVVAAQEKEPLRAEVADLRTRVDSLQAQVRSLEKRFDQ